MNANSAPMSDTNAMAEVIVAALQRHDKRGRPLKAQADRDKKRFVWTGGCHECGCDHMKRDCQKWQKLMAESNNNIPEGHTNAYTKARDAFNKKNGIAAPSPKPRVRPVEGYSHFLNSSSMRWTLISPAPTVREV